MSLKMENTSLKLENSRLQNENMYLRQRLEIARRAQGPLGEPPLPEKVPLQVNPAVGSFLDELISAWNSDPALRVWEVCYRDQLGELALAELKKLRDVSVLYGSAAPSCLYCDAAEGYALMQDGFVRCKACGAIG